jgi:hypothetical protein
MTPRILDQQTRVLLPEPVGHLPRPLERGDRVVRVPDKEDLVLQRSKPVSDGEGAGVALVLDGLVGPAAVQEIEEVLGGDPAGLTNLQEI